MAMDEDPKDIDGVMTTATIACTLIATVMFASAFPVPGGHVRGRPSACPHGRAGQTVRIPGVRGMGHHGVPLPHRGHLLPRLWSAPLAIWAPFYVLLRVSDLATSQMERAHQRAPGVWKSSSLLLSFHHELYVQKSHGLIVCRAYLGHFCCVHCTQHRFAGLLSCKYFFDN